MLDSMFGVMSIVGMGTNLNAFAATDDGAIGGGGGGGGAAASFGATGSSIGATVGGGGGGVGAVGTFCIVTPAVGGVTGTAGAGSSAAAGRGSASAQTGTVGDGFPRTSGLETCG